MKRKRGWQWAKLVGLATVRVLMPTGSIYFCLPPPSIVQQWPADGGICTPEPQLTKSERRAWAVIKAGLCDIEAEA